MKKYLMLLVLLFSTQTQAFEDIPAFLEDGVITVTLKSGKQYFFSSNTYKVVPRGTDGLKDLEVEENSDTEQAAIVVVQPVKNRNRIRLLVGSGPSGDLTTSTSGNTTTIENDHDMLLGLGYDRLLTDEFSIGGQVLTNETLLFSLGLDY